MAFKVINNFIKLNGLIPTLLVFKVYPQIIKFNAPSPTVTQHAIAFKKAIEEIKKI